MIKYNSLLQHTTLASTPEGGDALISAQLSAEYSPLLYIARDDLRMQQSIKALRLFTPYDVDVLAFPAWDTIPYDRISPHQDIVCTRLQTLSALINYPSNTGVVVTTVNAILQRIPPKEFITSMSKKLEVGDKIDHEEFIHFLINSGYRRSSAVYEPGEFAVRGSIIDLFNTSTSEALRLDFFGSQLESIKHFDPLTQISKGSKKKIVLIPANEMTLSASHIDAFKQRYRTFFGVTAGDDPLYDAISEGRHYPAMEHWLPLFHNKLSNLFDYMEHPLVCMDHLLHEAIDERVALIEDHYQQRKQEGKNSFLSQDSYHPLSPSALYLTKEDLLHHFESHKSIAFTPYKEPPTPSTKTHKLINLEFEKGEAFYTLAQTTNENPFVNLQKSIKQHPDLQYVICCFSQHGHDRMLRLIEEYELIAVSCPSWGSVLSLEPTQIAIVTLPLEQGFKGNGYYFVSEQDLLGERYIRRSKIRKKPENFIREAASLQPGEYIVHKEHGIGRFEGLTPITVDNITHDCLHLIYDGGDKLYLPVENIDLVSRYGPVDSFTKLDKLGGVAWQARKSQLKKRIQIAAETLLQVAAEREMHKSPQFYVRTSDYENFCARFPFAETEDQLQSIADVELDLQKGTPMDRLICGDVGFGKTEIALRASFIVLANDHKERFQVAVVAPTTLLARQHYNTFSERFKGLPYTIRQLSRLVSTKSANETKQGLKDGSVDIIIGTHAVLAKSINFKQLGLLIIDEEQHFGVGQKERIKQLKSNVHVLTLTATPIPRTLQMSLAGIKEMSIIAEAPVDRLAVRSFVMPFDSMIIREAILRECFRGGQSFYVCPRIKDLEKIHDTLKKLVPEIKIAIAHGQMPANQLDIIMNEFYDRKYDLLLSTTIVESGLDISSANTMIIHRADMFGLSQLYQLRGRVGRSKVRAYCYFTLPNEKLLSKDALKRLDVMQSLDMLGAGFQLASHDMDIRGGGNLLGDEQSGHIKEVGVELYQQMLKETIESLKTHGKKSEDVTPTINIRMNISIPDHYVADLTLRMGLYRRIGFLQTVEEIEAFREELIDRFGTIPLETEHLLSVIHLKQLCRKAAITKVDVGKKGIIITFSPEQFNNIDHIITLVNQDSNNYKLRPENQLLIKSQYEDDTSLLKGLQSHIEALSKT